MVKANFTLEQAIKAQRDNSTLSLISQLDGWVVNATPRPSYPRGRPGIRLKATPYIGRK